MLPTDGPKQGPKHVVTLNKYNNKIPMILVVFRLILKLIPWCLTLELEYKLSVFGMVVFLCYLLSFQWRSRLSTHL